jgi:hypothetical protein
MHGINLKIYRSVNRHSKVSKIYLKKKELEIRIIDKIQATIKLYKNTSTISTTSTTTYFVLKINTKSVEIFFNAVCKTSTRNRYLHQVNWPTLLVEIPLPSVEIPFLDTSTKRSPKQAPLDKISKSGDCGCSRGSLSTVTWKMKT